MFKHYAISTLKPITVSIVNPAHNESLKNLSNQRIGDIGALGCRL